MVFAAWVMWGHCLWGLTVTPGVRTTGCFLSLDVPTSLAEQGVAGSRLHLSENAAGFTTLNLLFFSGGDRGDGFPGESPELTWYLLPAGESLAFGLF